MAVAALVVAALAGLRQAASNSLVQDCINNVNICCLRSASCMLGPLHCTAANCTTTMKIQALDRPGFPATNFIHPTFSSDMLPNSCGGLQ